MEYNHKPVLIDEVIEGLNIKPNGIYVDGTLGGAGHSLEIVKRLKKGLLIGIDKDIDAINASKEKLKKFKCVKYINRNHDDIKDILDELEIMQADGILLDLGVSSYQLDEKDRGFSYMNDSRLDMRMDKSQSFDAEKLVNTYKEEDLSRIIYEYGEEKYAKKIAKNICLARKVKRITSTKELAEIIEKSKPYEKNGHPAKKTFQAIRIEVNNEIKPLNDLVLDCIDLLKTSGRLCIISFHSLEDRAVKEAFSKAEGRCMCPPGLPYCMCGAKCLGKVITKKPIIPSEKEKELNPRSKSAKLRIFEKGDIDA